MSKPLTPAERRHAILSTRAALLNLTAGDFDLPLLTSERRVLREVAVKVEAAADRVLRASRERGE